MKNQQSVILTTIMTLACVGQIALAFLLYNEAGYVSLINLGWVILWISAIFGWLPIYTLRKWGKVTQGKSYVHTTVLVERGVYAIVRHPQYLAGMLIGIALPMISQHLAVALVGVVVVTTFYLSAPDEEAAAIEKFGEAYKAYMQRVPRFNFLLGLFRWIKARNTGRTNEEA